MESSHQPLRRSDQLLLPGPTGRRESEPARPHSDSVCAASVWSAGGADRDKKLVGIQTYLKGEKKDNGAHQEVEGQLEFLQTVNELGLSWRLGSQGQNTLCGRIRQ